MNRTRLLYVAMTRAKRSLSLSAAPMPRKDGTIEPWAGTLLKVLWPVLRDDFESPASVDAEIAPASTVHKLRRLVPGWIPPSAESAPEREHLRRSPIARSEPASLNSAGWAKPPATSVLSCMRHWSSLPRLQSFLRVSTSRVRQMSTRISFAAMVFPSATSNAPRARSKEAVTRTVEDERGRWIFSSVHRNAGSELALTGLADGRLTNVIIDRTFVDASGTRWVIDFKTSRHEGSDLEGFLTEEMDRYRGQLERNVALARGLGA